MKREVLDYKHNIVIIINMTKIYHYKNIRKYTNAKT